MNTLMHTDFQFIGQKSKYNGKVREVYTLSDDTLLMVATDRLSAFDVVMPKGIPFKGQILNQIASHMMEATKDIVPNWIESVPDPNVAVGKMCTPFKVEMVIRGYLSGHAAREYKAGKRSLCGVSMPEGMIENDPFPHPIITPATKAEQGDHDEDISEEQILEQGIVSESDYAQLKSYTQKLFARGSELAQKQGLILVDTKYEFGKDKSGNIVLIDEIHTPDSSRYFYASGYEELQRKGEPQKQLSKEFVRQWLIQNGFQGLEGQILPHMDDAYINSVSERYIELYENITGKAFVKADVSDIQRRLRSNLADYIL
ncbi:MAG: phosphoribosylaminoimidazolesuccinocarboxamide synthase [Flavobacteriaceae bacterium]|nr:phosphoribosylaminoimidazolesuccinocarboxamide synthase [Flavobacteriaceae bacterium]